jgi:hypothetical protein
MLKFRGGGGGSANPVQTRDSLATNDTVEVLVGISEGPIKGPVNGPSDIYADQTPLEDEFGNPNFSNFTLDFWEGQPTGDQVTMALGGLSSPITVTGPSNLAKNVPISVQGIQTQINAVDFRIVINTLYKQNSKGVYTEPLQLKLEYKKTTDQTWLPAFSGSGGTPTIGPINTGNTSHTNNGLTNLTNYYEFDGNRSVVAVAGAPTQPPVDTKTLAVDVAHNSQVFHWDTGSQVWVQALLTAGQGANYATFVDTDLHNTVRRVYRAGVTPDDARVGDIWDSPQGFLIWNGAAWVSPGEYGTFTPDPQTLVNGVWSITDKVSSATPVNIRCFVPAIDGTYQYRLTKLTTDTTQEEFVSVQWETLQEIKQTPLSTTNLAMLKVLGKASDQLTSIPNISGVYEGLLIKIPTNYDPVTRVYTGTWDGTYKIDYTSNTAFIFQDFVENTRYGLSSVYPHVCDKWAIYNWAQHCDVMVPKADGTLQPRWTYNDYVVQQRDAKEMAQYIAASAAAVYVDDGNGTVSVLYDDPSAPAVALFTQENVSPEGFSYSYTDIMTRSNDTIVSFTNPALLWQTDKRRLDNSTEGNRITDDFIATGCIDVDEALRRARRRQVSSLTEKEFVNFTTNRRGLYLSIWDVILVADVDMGRGLTGRIHSQSGNTVTLRDPIVLEPGFTYQGVFDLGLSTITQTVLYGDGSSLTFDSLPQLPEYATFSLECSAVGMPKPYRVLNIGDDSGAGELIQITAIELNRNKQAYIDSAAVIDAVEYSSFNRSIVLPPSNLKVEVQYQLIGGTTTRILNVTWDAATSNFVSGYKVYPTVDGADRTPLETKGLSVPITGADRGHWGFRVTTVNLDGKESISANCGIDVVGVRRPVGKPTDFNILNGTNVSGGAVEVWKVETQDTVMSWRPPDPIDPTIAYYKISIFDILDSTSADITDTPILLRNLGADTSYTFLGTDWQAAIEANSDILKDRRSLRVEIAAYNQDDDPSAPIIANITNLAPKKPTNVRAYLDADAIGVLWDQCTASDYAGTLVWLSTTPDFEVDPALIVFDGKAPQARIHIAAVGDYYVRVAHYDNLGAKSHLNVSDAQEVLIPALILQQLQNAINAGTDVLGNLSSLGGLQTQVDANAQTALNLAIKSIEDRSNIANQLLVDGQDALTVIADIKNSIGDLNTTLIGNIEASLVTATDLLNSTRSTLQTSIDATNAAIMTSAAAASGALASGTAILQTAVDTETTARQTAIDAEATARALADSITTTAIATEQTVRATGDSQLASTITTVSAKVDGNVAAIQTEQTARADAISAEATSRQTLAAQVGTNTAGISTESTVRATADGAISTRVDSVTAVAGANGAAIVTEQQARADAVSAEATARTTLAATVATNTAAIVTEQTTRATADSAEATARTTLAATVSTNTAAIVTEQTVRADAVSAEATSRLALATTVAGNVAAITTEATARSTADSAEATARTSLATTVAGNTAAITSESTARSTADGALSTRIDTLSASTGANAAAIVTEQTARSDAISAEASARTTLAAVVGTNTAGITSEASTRSTTDSSLSTRIDSLVASSGANAAGIVTEQQARADAISAEAASRTTLASVVSGNTAAIQTEASTRSTADSAEATARTTLASTVAGNTAAITSEATTRSTAISAEASARTTLASTVAGNTAGISSESSTRATADGSLSTRIDAVVATSGANTAAITSEATTRADAVSAEASARQALSTTVGNNSSLIVSEQTTRSNADGALGSRIDVVSASTGANAAAILTEQTARTDAISAEASARTTLATAVGNNASAIVSEATSRSTTDSAQATQISGLVSSVAGNAAAISSEATTRSDALSAQASTISGISAQVGANASAITDEAYVRNTADNAAADARYALQTAVNGNISAIYDEQNTRSNADSAVNSRVDGLVSTVGANTAAITSEASTRADAISAEASSRSSLASTVGDLSSSLSSEVTARSDAVSSVLSTISKMGALSPDGTAFLVDSAQFKMSDGQALADHLSGLVSNYNANASAIAAESTARSDAVSAVASTVSTLSTTVGGQTSSITDLQTVTADATGKLQAIATLALDVGGRITGYTVNGAQSSFSIVADNFNIVSSGGVAFSPFSYNSTTGTLDLHSARLTGSLNINGLFIVESNGQVTISSAASGARLVMNNGLLQVYDSSNVLRVKLGVF